MLSYLKTYLSVTKKEWNGLVILVMLIMLVLATPYVTQKFYKDSIINAKAIDKAAVILMHGTGMKVYSVHTNMPVKKKYTKKARLTTPLELNKADSAALTTVYGIGPSFARRIIKYRNLLGGFANKEQLKEVYGLNAEKYAEIEAQVTVDATRLKKINVNTATFDDMKSLPYLTFKQMNAIIQYRIQHGDYTSVVDMQEIAILDETTINKIKPYIVFK